MKKSRYSRFFPNMIKPLLNWISTYKIPFIYYVWILTLQYGGSNKPTNAIVGHARNTASNWEGSPVEIPGVWQASDPQQPKCPRAQFIALSSSDAEYGAYYRIWCLLYWVSIFSIYSPAIQALPPHPIAAWSDWASNCGRQVLSGEVGQEYPGAEETLGCDDWDENWLSECSFSQELI